MKISTPILLTATLLLFMAGAGGASGWIGYRMGYEALKGVSQPDVSPSQKLTQQRPDGTSPETEVQIILNEQDLIEQAEKIIQGQTPAPPQAAANEAETEATEAAAEEADLVSDRADFQTLQTRDRGVSLSVVDAREEGNDYVLEVSLKNEEAEEVQFLYSFLEVRDQEGRPLSAITEGLPGELPATGEWFSGTVRIPVELLENTEQLSLSLTDYPDQQLQLSLAEIPLVR